MSNIIMIIPILISVIIIGFIIYLVINSKKNTEKTTSILDVKEVGVSNDSDFSYGYEKEETIVMNPINTEEKEKNEEFPDVTEEDEIDITTTIKSFNKDGE